MKGCLVQSLLLDQCLIRNESTRSSPVWPGFDFRTQRSIYVEFVVSLLGPGVFHRELWKSFLIKNRPLIRYELMSPQTRRTFVHLAIDTSTLLKAIHRRSVDAPDSPRCREDPVHLRDPGLPAIKTMIDTSLSNS